MVDLPGIHASRLEIGLENEIRAKRKGVRFFSNPLIFLVAGGGFEPPTFGL